MDICKINMVTKLLKGLSVIVRRFYIKDEHFNFDASKRPALDVNQMFRCPQADIELRLKKYSRIFRKGQRTQFFVCVF